MKTSLSTYIKHFILRVYDYVVFRPFIGNPRVANTEQTIKYIIRNKCSVSRFGDGEIDQCWKVLNLPFQKWNPTLSKRLREILFSKDRVKNHIVCIPYIYIDNSHLMPEVKKLWAAFTRRHKFSVLSKLPRVQYYDTQCTRCYIDYEDKSDCGRFFELWKRVWNDENIVIVEGNRSRLGIGNDLFNNAKSIRRIIVPAEHCFDVYQEVLDSVMKYSSRKDLILLAAGPTATVLAYDLAKQGYWAMDVGHIDVEYSWYKMGVSYKCPIPGKYVNEVNSREVDNVLDEEYMKSIIHVIRNHDE